MTGARMKQLTLAMAADQGAGFEQHRRPTRREEFLATKNEIIPWADLCAVIEPYYPKKDNRRPPIGLERMLAGVGIQTRRACHDHPRGGSPGV